jgi:hypothetical protein
MKNLELNQMEKFNGGEGCEGLATGVSGAALVFGAASWWTGWGGGIALGMSAVAFALDMAGC